MNEEELAELLKYSNPKELYVVAWNNVLELLFCPFEVVVLHEIGALKKGERLEVEAVKVTIELKTVYEISGQLYYYNYFDIIIDEN
ncbi:hypothetical protein [Seonamhaeicola sp. ML3]|uniref:hypothetical protein n=1 Tax=Seonamhaeicola sp. ML3 TaxID=2937786 RepID=UPI00200FE65E|nr:hypothetical protein [Seonamhaeicola sp. ML3]